MVLDWEQDETVRVLLEDGLLKLLGTEFGGLCGRLLCFDDILGSDVVRVDVLDQSGDRRILEIVLLVRDSEVKLLDRGLHLEGLNGRGSLLKW